MADISSGDMLTAKQHKALAALLSEPTIRQAAIVAGVPDRTLYNWLKDPDFTGAYQVARREAVQQATARLQHASSAAVTVIQELMEKDTVHASIRLSAATKVLDLAIKAIELDDIAARLAALEAAYAAKA